MPRPRSFWEAWTSGRIVDEYKNGVAPRVLARHAGLSRWHVGQILERAGVRRRDHADAHQVGRWVREYREDQQTADRCAWPYPSCDAASNGSGWRLCSSHAAEVEHFAGERRCGWPTDIVATCNQRAVDGLCGYHEKVAAGLT